jgi:hypothetical protein
VISSGKENAADIGRSPIESTSAQLVHDSGEVFAAFKCRSRGIPQLARGEDVEERYVGNLPGAKISGADLNLDEVCGDHVHQNSGQHLDGGITEDAIRQGYWRRLIVYHYRQ